jgi:beta-lactamase superfamily II metal-dependent hydrolase
MRATRRLIRATACPALLFAMMWIWAAAAAAQGNGNLQIHFMNVGQGDGALLISPHGEKVLFDDGVGTRCDLPLSYLQQLGVDTIDYHIASHYHYDHIGCTKQIFDAVTLKKTAFDRGFSSSKDHYDAYIAAIGTHRKKATTSTVITLDANQPNPVTIKIVALNANGISTNDENDKSVVAVVQFGNFSAEIGGDLSGFTTERYKDIETSVAPKVGPVDVYKVHHHGSDHSTNETWLQTIAPTVAIISVGESNTYGHPTSGCLERLHGIGVRTFWTSRGKGAAPDPMFDRVCGNVIVEAAPGSTTFTVTCTSDGHSETFASVPGGGTAPSGSFAWSERSKVYHVATCSYVQNITAANLRTGSTPPGDRTLHQGCPK